MPQFVGLCGITPTLTESNNSDEGTASTSRRELHCPKCKVTISVNENRSRQSCPYCGSSYNGRNASQRSLRTPTSRYVRNLRIQMHGACLGLDGN